MATTTVDLGSVIGPQGPKGDTGAQGPKGATGPKGEDMTVSGVVAGSGLRETISSSKKTISASPEEGSVRLFANDANPAQLYGGTWTVRPEHLHMGWRIYVRTA